MWAKVVDQGDSVLKPSEIQTDPAPVLSTQEAGLRQLKPLGIRGFPGRLSLLILLGENFCVPGYNQQHPSGL